MKTIYIYFTSGGMLDAPYTEELHEHIKEEMKSISPVMDVNGNIVVKANVTYAEVRGGEESEEFTEV